MIDFRSDTQANLMAIMSHCGQGDEYLCGQSAHNYRYEGGGGGMRQAGILAAAGRMAM